jgi:signal transduction histidine kinase
LVPVAIGAWVAAEAMFLSTHDLTALEIVLVAAGAVGIVNALVVGYHVGRASGSVIEVARRVGEGEVPDGNGGHQVPLELARVCDALVLAAERLSAARRRQAELERGRRELVAWVSHDLRTPLASIRAVTEALEDRIVSEPTTVARYHTTLRIEADRLSALVDDLFDLSLMQAGLRPLDADRVGLGDLVSDALAGAAPLADAKAVHLHGRITTGNPTVHVSTPDILRALRNVLDNAVRHTPSGGEVVVEAGTDDRGCFVVVRDTGPGIPEAHLPLVFDVGFSGDDVRSPGSRAGLGLPIARALVEAHNGEIAVANEPTGATVRIRLPLAGALSVGRGKAAGPGHR